MSKRTDQEILGLEDLLAPDLAQVLKQLAPGVAWALDALVVSFGEEVRHLDAPARQAFSRLTLQYGQYLDSFLHQAQQQVSPEAQAARQRKMEALRHLELFAELNAFDLGQIACAFEERTYPKGAVLMREGEPGQAVFFLVQGQMGIFVNGNQVAVRGEGALFGEMSVITDEPASATLRTISQCILLVISRPDFENHVLKLPEIVPQFARIGVARLGDVTYRLGEVLSHMPEALLKLNHRGDITGDVSRKCFDYLAQETLTSRRFSEVFFKDQPNARDDWERLYPRLWDAPERASDPDFPLPRSVTFSLSRDDERYYELKLYPCLEQGSLAGFDVAIADLTEQRKVREERERMERALYNIQRKYLTFRMAGETYGVPIERTQEILDGADLTRVPNAPAFLKGLLNLRGRIIPAVDLRTLLGLPPSRQAERGSVFIVEIALAGLKQPCALIVDEVTDIVNVAEREIEPPPHFGPGVHTGFLQGLAKTEAGVRILLDLDRLLAPEELRQLAALSGKQASATPGAKG